MTPTDSPTLAQRVRMSILESFVEHSVPPVVEQLMSQFSLARTETVALLGELTAARHIALVKGTARILMAWPFSAIATPFVARARGRTYYANCSWDAIALHSVLVADMHIDSFCHHCARPIAIELSGGRATLVEPAATIVYLALGPSQWWADIIATCSNTMVFFCSPEHRDASDLCAPADQAASLTPDQTHELSVPLYAGRLSIGYVRPSREELLAHFAALGLTGPYWTL